MKQGGIATQQADAVATAIAATPPAMDVVSFRLLKIFCMRVMVIHPWHL
jgi:hypothetical protein